jgi:hypothetical protein
LEWHDETSRLTEPQPQVVNTTPWRS